MMKKRMLAVAVLMAGVLTFAGCGNSGSNVAEADTAAVESQVVPADKSSVAAPAESGVAAVSTESDSIAADTESIPTESSVAAPAEPGSNWEGENIVFRSRFGYEIQIPAAWGGKYVAEDEYGGDGFYVSDLQVVGHSGMLMTIMKGSPSDIGETSALLQELPPLADGTTFYAIIPQNKPYEETEENEALYTSLSQYVPEILQTFGDPKEEEVTPEPTAVPADESTVAAADESSVSAESETTESTVAAEGQESKPEEAIEAEVTQSPEPTKKPLAPGSNTKYLSDPLNPATENVIETENEDGTYYYESNIGYNNGVTAMVRNQCLKNPNGLLTGADLAREVVNNVYENENTSVTYSEGYSGALGYPSYLCTWTYGTGSRKVEGVVVEAGSYVYVYTTDMQADVYDYYQNGFHSMFMTLTLENK